MLAHPTCQATWPNSPNTTLTSCLNGDTHVVELEGIGRKLTPRTASRILRILGTYPRLREQIYGPRNAPKKELIGYTTLDLSRLVWGSYIRMAELTKALEIATFHGSYPERLLAAMLNGLWRARNVLFFEYVSSPQENRLLERLRRTGQRRILDVHDIPHLQQRFMGVKVSTKAKHDFHSFARKTDFLLFPSHTLAKLYANEFEHLPQFAVLPNAANPTRFTSTPLPTQKVFLYIGGYAKSRGVNLLLDAFRMARKRRRDIWLNIVSPGISRSLLGLRKQDGITLMSNITYDHGSPEVFRQSYACIIPHLRNPYMDAATPIKLFESMASARPVISTNCYEMAKIVTSERCGLVVEENVRDLADAIETLANDRKAAERMGASGRRAVEARHSWKIRAKSLMTVLKSDS